MKKNLRLFLLDNYDSFTFNLAHQITSVAQNILLKEGSGLTTELVIKRNDEISIEEIISFNPTCLFISPGPGKPETSGILLDLLNTLGQLPYHMTMPIFGVCLGHQALIAAEGGNVGPAKEPLHGVATTIRLVNHAHPLLLNLPSTMTVGRYHSLIATPPIPKCYLTLAYSEQDEVMAIAHKSRPWWGVQFHPESFLTEQGDRIIHNVLNLAREHWCQ